MKLKLFMYAAAFMALLLYSCDKAKHDVLPASFNTLALHNDYYTTQINQPVLLSILANDTITGTATITLEEPANGTLAQASGPGQFMYQPEQGFTGSDSFTYTACIEQTCRTATVTVLVTTLSCTLSAQADTASTGYNTPVVINVLSNDDLCNGPVTIELGSQTIRETVTVQNNNTLLFTPANGFYGVTSFSYRISNGSSVAEAIVKVTVRQPITQLCTSILTYNDNANLYPSATYPDTLNLKSIALANDQFCSGYPVIFELLPGNVVNSGVIVPATIGAGSDTTYLYISNHSGYGYEQIAYRLRQQLPTSELVSQPAFITIFLNPELIYTPRP